MTLASYQQTQLSLFLSFTSLFFISFLDLYVFAVGSKGLVRGKSGDGKKAQVYFDVSVDAGWTGGPKMYNLKGKWLKKIEQEKDYGAESASKFGL